MKFRCACRRVTPLAPPLSGSLSCTGSTSQPQTMHQSQSSATVKYPQHRHALISVIAEPSSCTLPVGNPLSRCCAREIKGKLKEIKGDANLFCVDYSCASPTVLRGWAGGRKHLPIELLCHLGLPRLAAVGTSSLQALAGRLDLGALRAVCVLAAAAQLRQRFAQQCPLIKDVCAKSDHSVLARLGV
jgi:hypothetical protein